MNNIDVLKKIWDNGNFESSWNYDKAQKEYKEFLDKYPKPEEDAFSLTLDEYTNIKDGKTEYFTYFVERKTEHCGKFRTASSFAYGVYKVNPNNIKNEEERKKAEGKYRIYKNGKKSKEYVDKNVAEIFFKEQILPKIKKLINFEDLEDTKPLDINYARKVAYLYNPDKLIPIYKKDVIKAIANFFGLEDLDFNSYKVTEPILSEIVKVFQIEKPIDFQMSQKIGAFLWKYFGKSVSFDSKNIIYYGPPGTGKTYTVDNAVKQKVLIDGQKLEDVSLFTQFHPSYAYEDFIEGLKPHIRNGATELKLRSGIFKKFCKIAMNTLKEEREKGIEDEKLTKYYFVIDEINRAELSAVFGEVLVCLEENKRVDFDKNGNITNDSKIIETQYSYLIENDTDAVLTISGKHKFGIPANLYFIGTMNDVDRSIDSFDLALRRRFLWERKDFDKEVIANYRNEKENKDFTSVENIEEYIESCEKLNDYLSKTLELGKSYEIGHSYFLEIKVYGNKIIDNNKNELFDKKLKPLIEEYLRGNYDAKKIEGKIKEAREKFGLK